MSGSLGGQPEIWSFRLSARICSTVSTGNSARRSLPPNKQKSSAEFTGRSPGDFKSHVIPDFANPTRPRARNRSGYAPNAITRKPTKPSFMGERRLSSLRALEPAEHDAEPCSDAPTLQRSNAFEVW